MPRRMGRPGLLGTMARTAAISGTATAVSGRVQRNQARRAQADYDQQLAQQQVAAQQTAALQAQAPVQPTPAQPTPAPAGGGLMDELQKLADMKASGLLDDAEFAAAKAKLLA
ncbi:MAG: SHOCT domain-containing protein [Microthrixaceae bacterium]